MPGARILVVDDDALVRRTIRRTLERAGHDVVVAPGGREALAMLDTLDGLDLMITDVMMDDLVGPELADAVNARLPALPVLFMSGETPENLPGVWLDKHQRPFLEKPFRPDALLAQVDALTAR